MGKKFLGLGGTDHFWDRAKAWILNQITSAVAAKIAEVVANAPEDLDTLKEIADWIKAHANDAAAMNTQITENKNNIASLSDGASAMNTQIQTNKNNIAAMNTQITENKNNIASLSDGASAMNTQIQTNKNNIAALQTSVAGKADKAHTHSTGDITSGTLPIANGGTGVTTQADINKAFIVNLETGESDVTDGTEFVSSWASDNGFAETTRGALNTPYKRKFINVWNYIKNKISSVLGLTGKKLTLQGGTVSSNSYTDTNPKLEFKNADGSQNISLTFTDYDAVQEPASLTLNGNQGNEYFIAPNIKATRNITLDSVEGATTSTYGLEPLTIGFPSGTGDGQSLGFDRNSIQAKRNGEVNVLYLNYHGGIVSVNEPNNGNGGLKVKQKMVIPIGAPSSLEDGCIWIER